MKNIFVPIYKVDASKRQVWGRITDETVDLTNEICDYETSAPLFKAWSEKTFKTTSAAGQEPSLGNVRVMHGLNACGKLIALDCEDTAKAIDCGAEIVDDLEWLKVLKGVYTGFSLGGRVIGKKWKDASTGAQRYTVDPYEVSLVDQPCNGSATFTCVKADGAEETVTFAWKTAEVQPAPVAAGDGWIPENAAVEERARKHADDAGTPALWFDHIEKARGELIVEHGGAQVAQPTTEITAAPTEAQTEQGTQAVTDKAPSMAELLAVEQVWRTADGQTFKKKPEAADHAATLVVAAKTGANPILDAVNTARRALAAPNAQAPAAKGLRAAIMGAFVDKHAASAAVIGADFQAAGAALKLIADAGESQVVMKGLWTCRDLAALLCEFRWLQSDMAWEEQAEGDGSPLPQVAADIVSAMGSLLIRMTQEEVGELLAELGDRGFDVALFPVDSDPIIVELAAKMLESVRGDEELVQKAGARNSKKDAQKIQGIHDHACDLGAKCAGAEKTAGAGDDVVTLKAQNVALVQQIEEGTTAVKALQEDVTTKLAALQGEIEVLKAQPGPGAPRNGAGTRTVDKTEETGGGGAGGPNPQEQLVELLSKMSREDAALAVIKAQQSRPQTMTQMGG